MSYGRCSVRFRPGLARRFRPADTAYAVPQLLADANVVKCVCQKTMDGVAGTFEIDLTYDRRSIGEQIGRRPPQALSWNLILLPDNVVHILFARGQKLPASQSTRYDPFFMPGSDELTPWMVGLIDSVTEVVVPTGKGVQHIVRVRGRDFGKILQDHQLHWQDQSFFILDAREFEARKQQSLFCAGPPRVMIERVLDILTNDLEMPAARDLIIYKPNQTRQTGALGEFAPSDIDPITHLPVLDPRLTDEMEHGAYKPTGLWDRGRFANFLERLNDRGFTELWTDTRPDGYFSVYLRPVPFDREDWERLPGRAVPDSEILQHQILRSDAGRINMVMLYAPDMGASNIDPAFWDHFNLRWDRFSYENGSQLHGLKKLVLGTYYSVPERLPSTPQEVRDMAAPHLLYNDDHNQDMQRGEGPVMDLMRKKGEKLWRWHYYAHRMHSGRYIVVGDPFWRVGYRFENEPGPSACFVEQEDKRRWGYVQTVTQEYVRGSHYRTHLGLTRGVRLGQVPGEKLVTDGFEFKTPWTDGRQKEAAAVVDEIDL